MSSIRIVGSLRDARAQRAREAALDAARVAAEQQNAGKSRFLANMSHELRTPLNAIMGFSDIMKQRLFGPMSDRYAEYAELIHESGAHLLELIGDVLDMSKIEAERYELTREGFDARVAAADEDEGESGVADGGVAGGGGDVHLLDDVVAQPDGLFDRLEPDGVLGEAGDGERAGDRAGGEDELVVGELLPAGALVLGGEGGEGGGAFGVVDRADLADDDPAAVEDAAQGYDDVAG